MLTGRGDCKLPMWKKSGLNRGPPTANEFRQRLGLTTPPSGPSCILISIFLVRLTPKRKMELPSGLQAGGQRFTRERLTLAGSQALRGAARSTWTPRSKLEPLLEHAGLSPAGLVFPQV